MAFTSQVAASIVDFSGKKKTATLFVPAGTPLADLEALAQAWASAVDDVIGGVIEGLSVSLSIDLPAGLKAAAVVGDDANEGLLLTFSAANTSYAFSTFIPAVSELVLVNGSLDTGDGQPGQTLANIYVAGTAAVDPTDRYGNDLMALRSAEKTFRK